MSYISKIPFNNESLERLETSIPMFSQEQLIAAFSMTGMDAQEVLKLTNVMYVQMTNLNQAYSDVLKYKQGFVDAFTTSNNNYFLYLKTKLSAISAIFFGYKRSFLAFLPSPIWHRRNGRRGKRDLYANSTLSSNAPLCFDMFPDAYPSYVNDFLDCLERFLRRFRECIHEVNQVNNAVRRRKADGKACLQCLINYRDSFMNMIAPLYEMLNIKPSSKWQNPVYVTMKKCKDEERTAAELYHNCDEKLLNESLIYLHSESELQKHIPLGYFAAHIDDVLPKYNESQLIAELYCYYGLECTLQSFYDDYSSCRKSIGKPVTVKYKAVDKAKNAKHKNNYAKQIDAVAKTYSVVKQQNNVEVSISHPDYPHSFTAM